MQATSIGNYNPTSNNVYNNFAAMGNHGISLAK